MSDEFRDPYIDPETGTLRNLVGALTYDELQNAKGEFVALRMSEFLSAETTVRRFCLFASKTKPARTVVSPSRTPMPASLTTRTTRATRSASSCSA